MDKNPAPERAAVIAIGSNSTRMLCASLDGGLGGAVRGRVETRLFLALDAQGHIGKQALDGLVAAVAALKAQALAAGAQKVALTATSAVRDSRDLDTLGLLLKALTGLQMRVMTGQEEARYAFLGAVHPYLREGGLGVIDVGGGSTEIALGSGEEPAFAHSLQLGASRLYARQPINSPEEMERALGIIREQLDRELALPGFDAARWLLVGGTGTALAYLLAGGFELDVHEDHHFTLEQAVQALGKLSALSPAQRAALPGMTPGREHILPTGLAILTSLMDRLGIAEMLVTHRNNCDGYLYGMMGGEGFGN